MHVSFAITPDVNDVATAAEKKMQRNFIGQNNTDEKMFVYVVNWSLACRLLTKILFLSRNVFSHYICLCICQCICQVDIFVSHNFCMHFACVFVLTAPDYNDDTNAYK